MSRYLKSHITRHESQDYSGPAINVKTHGYKFVSIEQVVQEFGCNEHIASKALEQAFNVGQDQFWDAMQREAEELFGSKAEVFSMGRSGGWLYVQGIDSDVSRWDARMVAKWGKLVKAVEAEMLYLLSWDYTRETIEANGWAIPAVNYTRQGRVIYADGLPVVYVDRVKSAQITGGHNITPTDADALTHAMVTLLAQHEREASSIMDDYKRN